MFTSARNSKILRTSTTLALALAGLAGQAAHADNFDPILGGGLGAMAGALVGQSMGGRDGALVGAAVGGVAGVSIASDNQRYRLEPAHREVYQRPYRPAPVVVYEQPYRPAPVVVYQQPYMPAPTYGYRVVEQVNYYPPRGYVQRGWERHDGYRRDWEHRGGGHHGWDRRD
jgi:hypothetical protein